MPAIGNGNVGTLPESEIQSQIGLDPAQQLIKIVNDELVKLYPSTRGLKDGMNYIENTATNMVSIYAEIGFHDNPADASFIISNKAQIASAICRGICHYFHVEYSLDNLPDTE